MLKKHQHTHGVDIDWPSSRSFPVGWFLLMISIDSLRLLVWQVCNSFPAFLFETSFSQQNLTTSNLEAWHKLWIPSIQEREEPREEAEEEASATEDGKGWRAKGPRRTTPQLPQIQRHVCHGQAIPRIPNHKASVTYKAYISLIKKLSRLLSGKLFRDFCFYLRVVQVCER